MCKMSDFYRIKIDFSKIFETKLLQTNEISNQYMGS